MSLPPPMRDLTSLYRASVGFVHRKARRLLGNEADAMEVTQEVYLRAHASWAMVQAHPSPVGWLLTTTARLAIDRLRRSRVSRREVARLGAERSGAARDPRG